MRDDPSELDVPSQIELTLCMVNAVAETVWADADEGDEADDSKRLYLESREQLISLLKRLRDGGNTPEYAEVELVKIQAALDSCVKRALPAVAKRHRNTAWRLQPQVSDPKQKLLLSAA